MHLVDEYLSVSNPGIGIPQIHPAVSQGFDFGAHKDHTRFVGVFDVVIVPGLAVLGNYFFLLGFQFVISQGLESIHRTRQYQEMFLTEPIENVVYGAVGAIHHSE